MQATERKKPGRKPGTRTAPKRTAKPAEKPDKAANEPLPVKAEAPAPAPKQHTRKMLHRPFAFWEEGILREWHPGPVPHDHVDLLLKMGAPLHEAE